MMFPEWVRRRAMSRPGAAVALATSVVVAANTPRSLALPVGVGSFLLAGACLRVGRGLSTLSGLHHPAEQRFLIGLFVLAYMLALPVKLLNLSVLVGAGLFVALALVPARSDMDRDAPEGTAFFLSVVAAAGFAVIWSLESSARLDGFAADGVFRLWVDFFIHAGAIAEFGDVRTIGRVNAEVADVPGYFYHFASYALPGLAVRLTDISPMRAVAAIWLPLGIMASALGVFALGRALAGIRGGGLALLLLAAVPDNASYGLKQGFLSFHWLMETAPGSLYGVPCACASLALLTRWCKGANQVALLVSAVLLVAVFLLRAHVFIWVAPAWAAACVVGAPWLSPRSKAWVLAAGLLAGIAGMLVLGRAEIADQGLPKYMVQYLELLHLTQEPTNYDGLYDDLISRLGHLVALGPGLVLAYAAIGGIPLLGFLIGSVIAWRAGWLRNIDIVPFALLAWAGALMLFAPTPFNNDMTEFRQRGFVLVVVVLLCWNARWLALLVEQRVPAWTLGLGAVAALVVTWANVAAWKAPRMAWAQSFREVHVAHGIIAASDWLRLHAEPGTAFAVATLDPNARLFDDATGIMGLSGDAAWVSRLALQRLAGPALSTAVDARMATLARVAAAPDFATVRDTLGKAGVSFYIVIGPTGPAWDPAGAQAAFRSVDCMIYRTDGKGAAP
jgi:hypothetical protein